MVFHQRPEPSSASLSRPIIVTQLKFRSESACRGYRAVPAVLHICLRTMGMVAFAVPKVITLTLE